MSDTRPAATPQYRPAYHFTPAAQWMNDPNGLVCHQGVYHLFFQYHPDSAVWGPMHWGHASSTDLLQWQELPVALRPDKLGLIFSGSVVVDTDNRAGLGPPGSQPLVAMFTQHNPAAAAQTRETQGLACSLDGGLHWTPHAGNPVLANPGLKDFRDPKLRWWPAGQRWIASLACGDRIRFYSSADLKAWTLESEFGADRGAHGGVWECPDLLPLSAPDGRLRWVLLVSLTPGGPNGGSATQYFVGDFDGHHFVPEDDRVRWLDAGPDNYAGVTWSGVDDRALFIGWMSNWQYAKDLPTAPWRSAMTMPRELTLRKLPDGHRVASQPARELRALRQPAALQCVNLALSDQPQDFSQGLDGTQGRFLLCCSTLALRSFTLTLGNPAGDRLDIGYQADANGDTGQWWIDRRHSGDVGFHPAFAGRHGVPRLLQGGAADLALWFDAGSVELFADGGLSTLTSLFFAQQPWSVATVASPDAMRLDDLQVLPLRDPR